MELHDIITRLERLQHEALALQARPLHGDEVRRWYDDGLETLDQIDGQKSQAKREFENIRFNFSPEMFQRAAELLRVDLLQYNVNVPEFIDIPVAAGYYRKPLGEAAIFLSSVISQLRGI
jgi:hypothetical protein